MKLLSTLTCAFALGATGAFAAVVNFENEFPLGSDPDNVGMSYSNGDITFTSTENMQLVQVGAPTSGFVPDDMPIGGSFGNVFLTGDFVDNTNMTLTFGSLLEGLTFDIADIDGGNDNLIGDSQEEEFTFTFLNGGIFQGSTTVNSNDVNGDGVIVSVGFAGLFDSVEIVGLTPGGTRNIGWGIDNIRSDVAPVPVPAAGLLLMSAIGGFAAMRRRKRAS